MTPAVIDKAKIIVISAFNTFLIREKIKALKIKVSTMMANLRLCDQVNANCAFKTK